MTRNMNKQREAGSPAEPTPLCQLPPSRIAIDIGNVISSHDTDTKTDDQDDVPLTVRVMENPVSEECLSAVAQIVDLFGAESVFLLSKCGGLRMKQASMIMLGRSNFFERTGVLPDHVLFCSKRSGGDSPALEDLQPLPCPSEDGVFEGLAEWFVPGAMVAPGRVGKGAMALAFGLTTLIDDRADCLSSFHEEGVLCEYPQAGLLLHALWCEDKPSGDPRMHQCYSWDEVLEHLTHTLERCRSKGCASPDSDDSGIEFGEELSDDEAEDAGVAGEADAVQQLARVMSGSTDAKVTAREVQPGCCPTELEEVQLIHALAKNRHVWPGTAKHFMAIVKDWYDRDVVSEDGVLTWWKDQHEDQTIADTQIVEQMQPFVDWLNSAPEEDSEEEDSD